VQEGVSASEVKRFLRVHDINVSVSGVGSTLLDFMARGLTEVVRASVHAYNSETEVESLLAAVAEAGTCFARI
jgi:cysteine desulfurase / selenocysteine lyase